MNATERVEERLRRTFAVTPDAVGLATLDRRVAAVIALPAAEPRRLPFGRRVRVSLALVAAFVALTGAAVGVTRLFERVAETTPGTQIAWDRGVDLGLRQVHGNYAVTVERAYADVNRVALMISVQRLAGKGNGDPGTEVELVDPTGRMLTDSAGPGIGESEGNSTASVVSFGPPSIGAGEYHLSVHVLESDAVGDAWSFAFTLPEPEGVVAEAAVSARTDAATVDLQEIRISPTMITAQIQIHAADRTASGWGPVGSIQQGTESHHIAWSSAGDEPDPLVVIGTVAGTDRPSGIWTIVIDELVGTDADGHQVQLQGPWRLTIQVP